MYNGAFSCKNLRSNLKKEAHFVNSNEYLGVGTHRLVLYFDHDLPIVIEFINDNGEDKVIANNF